MKVNMKKSFSIILMILMSLVLVSCNKSVEWNGKTEELASLLMVEDISDPYAYVGMVDYVFVGTVEEIIDGILPNKIKAYEDSFSTYKIHVDQNLKGKLIEEIEVQKMGGYKKDGTMCLITAEMPDGTMIQDTGLPEEGKQYIFLAYGQPNGELHLSELFDDREYNEELLNEYIDYVENEIFNNRERFPSQYAQNPDN